MPLSPNTQRVFNFLRTYFLSHDQSPTISEIADSLGFNSKTSVIRALKSLDEEGLINRDNYAHRSIELIEKRDKQIVSIPVIGMAACGNPILAIEDVSEYIPTDKSLLRGNTDDYFYLKASGDSMNYSKEPIHSGDLVLVHSQQNAEDGDVVVALIDDNATIKVLRKKQNMIVLQPQSTNPIHKPIILNRNFQIQGKVISVIGKI